MLLLMSDDEVMHQIWHSSKSSLGSTISRHEETDPRGSKTISDTLGTIVFVSISDGFFRVFLTGLVYYLRRASLQLFSLPDIKVVKRCQEQPGKKLLLQTGKVDLFMPLDHETKLFSSKIFSFVHKI